MANSELWDLQRLAEARGLCDWMFSQFASAVHGTVVEVGAGIGTFSERLLAAGAERAILIEPEPACTAVLRERFGADDRVAISDDSLPDSATLRSVAASADLVLCQNVLEHVGEDGGAVRSMAAAMRPGGRLVLLVPGHPRLFGALDRRYGHHRRYDRSRLERVVREAGLELDELYSFNALGIPGWWVTNRRRSGARIGTRSLRAYELLLRLWRPVETRWRPSVGLSLIAKAHRPPTTG
jgi:SAM-dependent methyltransferase